MIAKLWWLMFSPRTLRFRAALALPAMVGPLFWFQMTTSKFLESFWSNLSHPPPHQTLSSTFLCLGSQWQPSYCLYPSQALICPHYIVMWVCEISQLIFSSPPWNLKSLISSLTKLSGCPCSDDSWLLYHQTWESLFRLFFIFFRIFLKNESPSL